MTTASTDDDREGEGARGAHQANDGADEGGGREAGGGISEGRDWLTIDPADATDGSGLVREPVSPRSPAAGAGGGADRPSGERPARGDEEAAQGAGPSGRAAVGASYMSKARSSQNNSSETTVAQKN